MHLRNEQCGAHAQDNIQRAVHRSPIVEYPPVKTDIPNATLNHVVSPQTSKEGEPQQLSSPRQGAKALERALRMCTEKRPISLSSSATRGVYLARFYLKPKA